MRTDLAGTLRSGDTGREVALCGWVATRRDHGGVVFLDLRDQSGLVQVVIDPDSPGGATAHEIRPEYVLRVEGAVRARPEGTVNDTLPTGEVEIAAAAVEVLSSAEPPPFPLSGRVDVDEVLRLRHRYLDLRRPEMQHNLRLRATVNRSLRETLDAQGFVEVETPMLVASTPEGARDFVVPARLHHGSFYALPQSPQLFKQLLMVGGLDRYYQIARCLRDEDLRADRQFEFMQLDLEMSFADADDVMGVITDAVYAAAAAVTGIRPEPPATMTWHEAMARYGTDKPDVRFGLELVDVNEVFAKTEFRAFQSDAVRALRVSEGASFARNRLDALIERAKSLGAAGLVWMKVTADGTLDSPVAKFLSDGERDALVAATGSGPGDLILLVAGPTRRSEEVLGAIRLDLGRPAVDQGGLRFLWVTEFPLFDALDDDGRPIPAAHPFTMPHPDDQELLATGSGEELLAVRSVHYDFVCNGWELGSGSVRIHRRDLQEQVFTVLGLDPAQIQERFGFLLDAFRYGAPPHAGFAFGLDRLTAILAGEDSIREVIAFPKTQSGADPLTGAPTPLDEQHLRDLGLTLRKPKPAS